MDYHRLMTSASSLLKVILGQLDGASICKLLV